LKELESVKNYVQVIQHGLKLRFVYVTRNYSTQILIYILSESAVSQAKSITPVSISSVTIFQDLQKFVKRVMSTCSNVGSASGQQKLNVIRFLERVRDHTWTDIKAALFA